MKVTSPFRASDGWRAAVMSPPSAIPNIVCTSARSLNNNEVTAKSTASHASNEPVANEPVANEPVANDDNPAANFLKRKRTTRTNTGCNCKSKTRCLKRYCECFRRGEQCTPSCQCADCGNRPAIECNDDVNILEALSWL